ncbi:MAG: PTS transporter subunit EIIA [Hungatella sp.]|nr:PTS transporter subunit EIIA [Hungatella sp.]
MTVRQKRIWDLLVGESFLTAKEIGHHLHISDRTVRSDIKEINGERGREVILSKKGQGYYIEEPEPFWDMRAAGELENEENLEWEMIRRILFTGEVPYLELADEMYVSDTFLSKIVGRVNRRMAGRMRNGGIRKKKGCLVLELEEEEKRNYYNVYITTKNLNQFFEPESFSPYFEWVDICWIKELVLEKLGSRRNQFFDATIMRQEEVSSVQSFYKRLFHPSLFFPELEASSPREALEFLSSQLERQGYVNHTFLESVLGREEVAPTVFENGFVISHAMENTAVRSAICVGILKERIPWGDCNVKMVFLLALAPNWNQNMAPVYNVMISSMMKPGTMRQLSRIKDCKAFVNHLLS